MSRRPLAATAAALALVAAVCGCGSSPPRPAAAPVEKPIAAIATPAIAQRLAGRWALEDTSQTVMEITARPDGGLDISAWATADRVPYRVSEVLFDGRRLRAGFYYPPTRFKTYSNLIWIDANTLEGRASGDSTEWEVWRRLPDELAVDGGLDGSSEAPAAAAGDGGPDAGVAAPGEAEPPGYAAPSPDASPGARRRR